MSCISDYLCGYLLVMLFTIGKSENPGHGPRWFYPADDSWPPACKGNMQSPIEISDATARSCETFSELKLVNYNKTISCKIINDGHTVMIILDDDDDLYAIGGGLNGKYSLKQIHFHWQSEHTLNGKRVPLEAHFVHILNKDDGNRVKRADVSENEEIQVIAVFFKVTAVENTQISNVIDSLQKTSSVGSKAQIEFTPSDLMPLKLDQFYRYKGSLTTPPCHEIVYWTVFPSMVEISTDQYEVFRQTEGFGGKNTQNYRHLMPLNDRTVEFFSAPSTNQSLSPSIQINKSFYALILVIFYMF